MKLLLLVALAAFAYASNEDTIVELAKEQYREQFGFDFPYADKIKFKIPTKDDFEAWMKENDKSYASEDEKSMRMLFFQLNMWVAQALQTTELGTGVYGATIFSDLTPKEFRSMYTGEKRARVFPDAKMAEIPKINAPASIDWRTKGAVTGVKNQGQCGSCWAFSTTGNVEGQWFLTKGKLISLSESQLNDCDEYDDGCAGGLPSRALKYVEQKGLESEESYPYVPRDETCKYQKSKVVIYTNSSVHISKDETEMATWCAANGPISIGINADVMQSYKGGISKPNKNNCNPLELDHGVLIVGYGTESGTPFWIIKNSWGKNWGEEGYYRVHRGSGACGLNRDCNSAVIH